MPRTIRINARMLFNAPFFEKIEQKYYQSIWHKNSISPFEVGKLPAIFCVLSNTSEKKRLVENCGTKFKQFDK